MIYRLLFFCLLISHTLSGQHAHLLPHTVSSQSQSLDSLGYKLDTLAFSKRIQACGQLNQQTAVTLISDQGLILVARSAVLPFLPENINPQKGYWAQKTKEGIILSNVIVNFQLDYQDITTEILAGIKSSDTKINRSNKIARNSLQLKRQNQAIPGEHLVIKELDSGQTYHQYRLRTYTNVQLVGFPAEADEALFALLRLTLNKPIQQPKSLSLNRSSINNVPMPGVIIDFPSKSNLNSSSYEFLLQQIRNEILLELDSKVIDIHQDLGHPTSTKLLQRKQQNKAMQSYFQAADLFSFLKSKEQKLLLDPNCRETLRQLDNHFAKFEDLYTLKTYGQEAFSRVKLYQLASVLKNTLSKGPARYEQSKDRIKSYLTLWEKDWNLIVDQQVFAAMTESYFSRTKAQYLSPATIEQIAVTHKSYTELADLLYNNTILTQTRVLNDLLSKDFEQLEKSLSQDLAFRFLQQLSQDLTTKLQPNFRKENDYFNTQINQLAWQQRAFQSGQWVTEANGMQRIHFTNLLASGANRFYCNAPGLPNTGLAPILNMRGQLIGFRPENKQLSSAYTWASAASAKPNHPIIPSNSILSYLAKTPQAAWLLKEIKKAP